MFLLHSANTSAGHGSLSGRGTQTFTPQGLAITKPAWVVSWVGLGHHSLPLPLFTGQSRLRGPSGIYCILVFFLTCLLFPLLLWKVSCNSHCHFNTLSVFSLWPFKSFLKWCSSFRVCVLAKSLQLCQTLYDPVDCSPPGSCVHGILQARILEWVTIPSSRGSFWPRDRIHISCVSCTEADSLLLNHWGSTYNDL